MQLNVAGGPLAITGTPYSLPIQPDVYSAFSVVTGTVPPGLQIDTSSSTAVLDGTPTTPGFYSFVIRQTSTIISSIYNDFSFSVLVDQPITAGSTSLPAVAVGTPYSQVLSVTGGIGTITYGQFGGKLPPGLSLSLYGTLSGTVTPGTPSGLYSFTVYISDADNVSIARTYSIQVNAPIAIGPATLPVATVGSPFSQMLSASGGTGNGYAFSLDSNSTLPVGLTLSANGTLSGVIRSQVSTSTPFSFVVDVSDPSGATASQSFTLQVDPAITVSPEILPVTEAGVPYSQTLTATGGSGSGYTFSLASGGVLPTGLTLSSSGILSGTVPTTAATGNYPFTVIVTDSLGATSSSIYSFFVDTAMGVGPASLPDAKVGVLYSQMFTATGGSGIYSYSDSGNLPAGLTLSSGGVLSGTVLPTALAGTYNFSVTATDSLGDTCSANCSLIVDASSVTWTGAVSTAWSNPANWSPQSVPGASTNVTIPSHPTAGRCPVLDVAATTDNLTLAPGASLTLAGHALTVDGTVVNQGAIILQGNEAVTLADGNDVKEGTWQFVGNNTSTALALPDFGAADYFNLTIADPHTHPDTFKTTDNLVVNGNLNITCGTLTASGGSVTTCGFSLSSTGVLNAPAVLNDSGNWTVTAGTFNPGTGMVVFTAATGTQVLQSGGRAFYNLTHSGAGTLSLTGNALTVNGALVNAAGAGNFQTNTLGLLVGGTTTLSGGTFKAGAAAEHFTNGLTLNGGNYAGSSGVVTAGGVTVTTGTFTAPTTTLSDSGIWSVLGGVFNANNGTIALTGTNQHVNGSTTFHNLTKTTTTADTLTFQAGATETITGTLTLEGNSGHPLALRSSTPGKTWDLDPLSTVTALYLDVQDGVNVGKKVITASHAHNSGDDTGWKFA